MKYKKDIITTLNKLINKLEMAEKSDIFEQSAREQMIKEVIEGLQRVVKHEMH